MDTLFVGAATLLKLLILAETLIALLVGLALFALFRGRLQVTRIVLSVAFVAVLFIGVLPVGDWLLLPLERQYSPAPPLELATTGPVPVAEEALRRIGTLYDIEAGIRGAPPDVRCRIRGAQARPKLVPLRSWLEGERARLPGKSATAQAIRYALSPRCPKHRGYLTRR